jgi:hypothetical protein
MRTMIFYLSGALLATLLTGAIVQGCGKPSESNGTDSATAADEFTLVGEAVD